MEPRATYDATSPVGGQSDAEGHILYENNPRRKFVQVLVSAVRLPHLSDGAYRTYCNLIAYDWGDNPAFPGRERLAAEQGVSVRAIADHIKELRMLGLIVVKRRGLGKTNIYRITEPQEWTPDRQISAHQKQADNCTSGGAAKRPSKAADPRPSIRKESAHYVDPVSKQTQNNQDAEGTGADAPHADKPRRPSLKQSDPALYRDREAIKAAYIALSAQAANKWTNADCEALARDYGAEDSIATLTAMWGVQWANGRYPYRSPLKLSTAHELVPAWRRGELRSDPPATKGKPQQQGLDMTGGGPPTSVLYEERRTFPNRCPDCLYLNGKHAQGCARKGGAS